jgi:hypothetical protein
MDPISAFSLACNIIQVVDFGFKLAAGCRQIYASGSLESNDHIELVATDLRRISEEIEKADLRQRRKNYCRFWKISR